MDKIGIKLADGTFYPILEDGKPEKKNISLTTVKDGQTTVHVDLFRSPSGTMQDAQYIDTLEIDSLNPHTNGEPNLNFDIELGEDGALSAEIHDPETGKQSSRHFSLSALAGVVAEKLSDRMSDFSLKDDDGEEIDEPIELGKRQDQPAEKMPEGDDLQDMEDIFKAPEKAVPDEQEQSDSSFEDIVNDISNIGKDAGSQEAHDVIGPSPDSEAFSFDDFGDFDTKQDAVADESLEEISAEEALPADAEYVDSAGDETVDTVGVLDASLDQPDFGFKDLADEAGLDAETAGADASGTVADGFEDLGTLPDWSTGGLEGSDDDADLRSLPVFADDDDDAAEAAQADAQRREDEEKTASDDDNLAMENRELSSFSDDAAGPLTEEPLTAEPLTAVEAADSGLRAGEDGQPDGDTDASLYPPADLGVVGGMLSEDAGTVSEEPPAEDAAGQADDDFENLDLPSLNIFEDQPVAADSGGTRSAGAAVAGAAVAAATLSEPDDTAFSGDDFELPDLDFGDAVKEDASVDFSLPDFDRSSSSAFDDFDATLSSASDDWPSLDIDGGSTSGSSSPFMPSNMFDDLYDKETMEGKSSDGYEVERKTTKVPMFVCIVCAVICVLCLFFLFVIPTKFNVLRRDDAQEIALNDRRASGGRPEGKLSVGGNTDPAGAGGTASEAGLDSSAGKSSAGELIKPAAPASVSGPLPKVESVPAKENEIVIASVPSHVVPETPVRNVKKIPDIQYTVVWGDTLWDIANAYYKNPWKYTELAEYNHLKNPNFIQTGSILLIPAE